jgi:hypothetical protein
MPHIALGHSFISAMTKLDGVSVRKTAAFLERLVADPSGAVLQAEIIGSSEECGAISLVVSEDLRAIAREDGPQLLLLFVGRYNEAYDWATSNCFGRELPRSGMRIAVDEIPGTPVPGLAAVPVAGAWFSPVANGYELSRALEAAGIDHGLIY